MATVKTRIGTNPDGSPLFNYDYSCDHGCAEGTCTGGLLVTGPISGTVVLADGTPVSVTAEVIEHGPGQAGEILHHIELMHEKAGTFEGFAHTCTDACAPAPQAVPDVEAPAATV